jgi:hypothetical protein
MDLQAFLDELVCLPLTRGGETILRAFCSSALWQIYQTGISSSGCRNADLQLALKMQECRFTTPSQDVGIIVLSMGGMGYSLICLRSPDPTIGH